MAMQDPHFIRTTTTRIAALLRADINAHYGADYVHAAKWYELAVETNSAERSYGLSKLVRVGLGVEPNSESSLKLLKFAADQGHPRAQSEYGDCLMWGIRGAVSNPWTALEYYRKAAEQGWVDGFGGLSTWDRLYGPSESSGSESEARMKESQRHFMAALRKEAEGGDPEMQLRFGQALLDDNQQANSNENQGKGCSWVNKGIQGLQERSQRGDAFASVALAWFFKTATAIWKDGQKTRAYLEKAAQQDYRMPSEELAAFAKDYEGTWAGGFFQLANPSNRIAHERATQACAGPPSQIQSPSPSL